MTEDVVYTVADAKVVRVSNTGRVLPLSNGSTKITATFGDKHAEIPVSTTSCDVDLPINFGNQIVPIFTKLGCNTGACHGKISGQNGFRLSLLGFEPELDYSTLVKENRGRRISPSAPDASLLLLKSLGTVPHGGGKRMDVNSDEHKLIRRWIASGAPVGNETDPVVTHISVYPERRVTTRQNKAQFAVQAHYSDGTVEDVTRRAQFDSNDQEIAVVDPTGLVRTLSLSGEAAIMARYQGKSGRQFRRRRPAERCGAWTGSSSRRTLSTLAHGRQVEGSRHRPVAGLHRRPVRSPRPTSTSPARLPQ